MNSPVPSVDAADWIEARVPPMAALGVAVVAVSTSAILVRWSDAPSLVKAFYRVLFTTVLVAPLALTRHRGTIRALSRRDLLVAVGAGVALAVHFGAWFESLRWTSVAASVTLVQSQPLFVAVGAAFLLDERITVGKAVGIAVALVGMAVMSLGDVVLRAVVPAVASAVLPRVVPAVIPALGSVVVGGGALADPSGGLVGEPTLYGNGLALLGALMAAVYVLVGRSLRQRVALVPYVAVVYSVCALVLLAFALGRGAALLGYPTREWLLFLGMAVGPGLLGHTVINWALAHVESSVVSVTLLGEPVGSTILALVLLAEVPGVATVVGGGIVLSGIYVTARARA